MEEWKSIPGYEGLYEVSSYGRVKRLEGYDRFNRKIVNKLLKPSYNTSGYYIVHLYNNGFMKSKLLHRLVAQAFIPNPDNLPEVNHKDEDRTNNSVENLEWCNRKYNCNFGTLQQRRIQTNINNGKYSEPIKRKEHRKEYLKKYRDEHREHIREYQREYKREYMREYRKRKRGQ